ncbi:hypothetical protein [Vagococcus fluvialis]|uniref:hypothetical protein n=1 Tax=Vagococcus fluvialis TaxID=2738 RepID=UPI001D0B67F2|nr:hypothetical protein [Vagococcus fluvialis]UDM84082.1 hypothetical protein K5K96_15160 [Vagococcus fluvialis]
MAKKKINLDNLNVDLDIKDNAEELETVNQINAKYIKELNFKLQELKVGAFVSDYMNEKYRETVETFNDLKVKVYRHTNDLKLMKIKIYDFNTLELVKEYYFKLDSMLENSTDINRLEKRANKNGMVQSAIFLDEKVEYYLAKNLRYINDYLEYKGMKKVSKKDYQNNILYDFLIKNKYWEKDMFEIEEMKEDIISKTDDLLDENYKGLSKRAFFINQERSKQGLYVHLDIYKNILNVQKNALPSANDISGKRDYINQIYINYLLDFVSNKVIFDLEIFDTDLVGNNLVLDPPTMLKKEPVDKYFSLEKYFNDIEKKPLD